MKTQNTTTRLLFAALFAAAFTASQGASAQRISEVLYDGEGADPATVFVELAGVPGTSLSGHTLVGVNGNGGVDYNAIDLSSLTFPADGILVIAHPSADPATAAQADLFAAEVDYQNGPDSIQLRDGSGAVIDAVGYGDFAAAVFAGEGSPAADGLAGESLARDANQTDTDNNAADFALGAPTPGVGGSMDVPAGSCAGSCGGASADGSCYCDASCFQFGDCCADVCVECANDYAQCTTCTQDSDCAAGETCDVASGQCQPAVPPGCTQDSDCAAGETCNVATGQCQAPLTGSCGGSCGAQSSNGTCFCDAACFQFGDCCDDVCTECVADFPAECGGPNPECTVDGDCAAGEACANGFCVPVAVSGYDVTVDSVDATNFPSVSMVVSVTDQATGDTVGTLDDGNFTLIENGQPMENCTVSLLTEGTGTAKADIVFVFDSTGSMSDEIEDLRQNILAFTTELENSNIDFNLGLVVFGDYVEGIYGMTTDANEFRSYVQAVGIGSGGTENPLEAIQTATTLNLRADSERMFVLATDETYTVVNVTLQQAIDAVAQANVKVHAATLPELNADFAPLVTGSGGSFFDITASFASVLDDLSAEILNRYAITCDSPRPVRDNTTRDVTVQVNNGAQGGSGDGSYFVEGGALLVDPTFTLVDVGESFTVDIVASGVTDLQNAHIVLDFDETYLEFVGATAGELLRRDDSNGAVNPPFVLFDPAHDPAHGRIAVAVARQSEEGTDGTGVVVTLEFTTTRAAEEDGSPTETDDLVFVLGEGGVYLEDSANREIVVVDVQDGDVDTNGCGLLGDFDEDCDIDLVDFNILVGEFGSTSPTVTDIGPADGLPPNMTPNGDGIVNHHDLFVFTRMYNWFRFGQ